MRHVDDGTLHAWLDGEVTDRTTAAWLEEHLRHCPDCAARLAEARATISQSHALLSSAAPSAHRPAFDDIVQRAGGSTRAGAPRARWLMPVTWAASLALAAALGWTARDKTMDVPRADLTSSAPTLPSPAALDPAAGSGSAVQSSESIDAAPVRGTAPSTRGATTSARVSTPASGAAAPRAATPPARQAAAVEPREPSSTDARPVPPMVTVTGETPAVDVQAAERRIAVPGRGLRSEAGQTAADLAAPALPQATAAPRLESALEIAPAEAQARGRLASAPRSTGETAAMSTTRGISGTTAPASSVAGGRIALDATTRPRAWRTVSRTEAAALTRMPLYGIDGLTPAFTAVDGFADAVRTVYQLPSGASIELVQEPADVQTPGVLFTQPAQALAEAAAPRAEGGLARASQWSGVRGNARLTLRALSGTEDVAELSARLALD